MPPRPSTLSMLIVIVFVIAAVFVLWVSFG
ncbi:hypothetical protein ABIE65_002936 [Constrictibacter sp. MBR-5]|jgi:hypothetical protein